MAYVYAAMAIGERFAAGQIAHTMEPFRRRFRLTNRFSGYSKDMRKSLQLRFTTIVCLLLIAPVCLSAGENKKKAPEQFSSLSFVVLRDSSGKPIKNASVVLHSLSKDGRQERDGLQLKTDTDGKASIEDIPYGDLRLQVVAHGFQTYGDDVKVNQAKQEFVIRLKPPADQVSIYK